MHLSIELEFELGIEIRACNGKAASAGSNRPSNHLDTRLCRCDRSKNDRLAVGATRKQRAKETFPGL